MIKSNDIDKNKVYLICWNSDHGLSVVSRWQIEAIRHSEKKWYNGEPQMKIIRVATKEDMMNYEAIL